MSREQIVRDTAYAIWEAEGKPEGRAEAHWRQAEGRIAEHMDSRAQPPATGAAGAETAGPAGARPPSKGAAAKSAAKAVAAKKSAATKSGPTPKP